MIANVLNISLKSIVSVVIESMSYLLLAAEVAIEAKVKVVSGISSIVSLVVGCLSLEFRQLSLWWWDVWEF